MYEHVIFDLDGTLTDSAEGIMNSIVYCLNHYGIAIPEESVLRSFVGPPLSLSLQEHFGFSPEESLRAIDVFREYFEVKGIFENRLYDGIPEMLAEVKKTGRRLYIATAKLARQAERITTHFGIRAFFDGIEGVAESEHMKKATVIRNLMQKIGVENPASCLMIGDRRFDVAGAMQNKVDTLGVLYGYGGREELTEAGCRFFAETPADVITFLRNADETNPHRSRLDRVPRR